MQIFTFWGRKWGKCENSSSRPPKGTSLRKNASFDVQIVKISQPWRPVGEAKKRKKEKKVTVIFHTCAETPHAAPSLPYLEVKVGSPT